MSKNHREISAGAWAKLRREALERDGWRCQGQDCGKAGRLEVHHVVPLEHGGTNDLGNLITLCVDCHLAAHRELKPMDAWDAAVMELEQ